MLNVKKELSAIVPFLTFSAKECMNVQFAFISDVDGVALIALDMISQP